MKGAMTVLLLDFPNERILNTISNTRGKCGRQQNVVPRDSIIGWCSGTNAFTKSQFTNLGKRY